MIQWRLALHKLGHGAEQRLDRLKWAMRQRLGRVGPIQIQTYYGYGSQTQLRLQGRVLQDKNLGESADDDTFWDNLLAAYRRFESDEIPGAILRAECQDEVVEASTDEEGYFDIRLTPNAALPNDRLWHDVKLTLLDPNFGAQSPVSANARVLVPMQTSRFGVISDIDDTILQTNATNWLKMARLTFLQNARTRLPFEGVAEFYRGLRDGVGGGNNNPLFYVSSSPWNLYDLLIDFIDINTIPSGPLLLRDLGWDADKFIKSGHDAHKLGAIEQILGTYPALPFILIGDSGQRDPEIYRQVVHDFPGRMAAIYIRHVSTSERGREVQAVADELDEQGVKMLLVTDTKAAARHAAANGFIDPLEISRVDAAADRDHAEPDEVEKLLE